MGVSGALFCMGGNAWCIILGRWGWLRHYFGWVEVVGELF